MYSGQSTERSNARYSTTGALSSHDSIVMKIAKVKRGCRKGRSVNSRIGEAIKFIPNNSKRLACVSDPFEAPWPTSEKEHMQGSL